MDSQGANNNFDFNAAAMDFSGFDAMPQTFNDLKTAGEGNTSTGFFFGDEGIDTTAGSFDQQSFDSMFASTTGTGFGMQPLVSSFDYVLCWE